MTCLALTEGPPVAGATELAPMGDEPGPAPLCLAARIDLAARLSFTRPDPGIANAVSLPLTRVGLGLSTGVARAELGARLVRSGGDTGYLGVDGEAILPVIDSALVGWAAPKWGLGVEAGLVADRWARSGEASWAAPALAPTLGLALGWLDRSDLGGVIDLHTQPVRASVALTTGEGELLRETNEGKDLSAQVDVRPLADAPDLLSVAAFARDGSRGIGLARDHRVGGRIALHTALARGGVEALAAWGVEEDATRTPLALSAWAGLDSVVRLDGRLDWTSERLSDPEATTLATLLSVGRALPGPTQAVPIIRLGWTHTATGPAARAAAGADALATSDALFLQLDAALAFRTDHE